MSTEQITEALKNAGLTGTDATGEGVRSLAINVVFSEQEVRMLAEDMAAYAAQIAQEVRKHVEDMAASAARVANDATGPAWLSAQATPMNSLAERAARLDAAVARLAERRLALATVAEATTGR
jgi:hypothetical protein